MESSDAYILICVRNADVSFWRWEKQHRYQPLVVEPAVDYPDELCMLEEAQMVRNAFSDAMLNLTAKEREIVELVVNEEKAWPEVAEFLQIKVASAYRRYARAKKKLRHLLANDFQLSL